MKKEREERISATNQMSEAGISALHGAGQEHQILAGDDPPAPVEARVSITGRLGQLQSDWLQAHYTAVKLAEALAGLPATTRPYPLNIARFLQRQGGPAMPSADALLAADPVTRAESAARRAEALARIRALRKGLSR